jgi:hypothetical protein
MVYVPGGMDLTGNFYVGSDGAGTDETGSFTQANNTVGVIPFQITSVAPTLQGNNAGSSAANLSAKPNRWDLTGTTTAELATGFPTGYNAFYCMKYEITQQDYVGFLNTLTYTQQVSRTANLPNSIAGTGALITNNYSRNGIDIMTPGVLSTIPALYACNYDGDLIYGESSDGQDIACNYLRWSDLAAYLDWSGLRPMTELEFEKSCRGTPIPVAGEYAWGLATRYSTSYTFSGLTAGTFSEVVSNPGSGVSGNASYYETIYSAIFGPLRVGSFATSLSDRTVSGATYYGIMEMSGNVWERPVTLGNVAGRSFTGLHGDGILNASGDATVNFWPGINGNSSDLTPNGTYGGTTGVTESAGSCSRGGGFTGFTGWMQMRVSDRDGAIYSDPDRSNAYGGRGVRSSP